MNLRDHRDVEVLVERDELLLDDHFYRPIWHFTGNLYRDCQHFYSPRTLGLLGIGFGVHAVLANTSLDREFRESFQKRLTGDFGQFGFAKNYGETWVTVSILLGIWGADEWILRSGCEACESWIEMGDWSRLSLRALMIGVPVVGLSQVGIGASRLGSPVPVPVGSHLMTTTA